MGLSISEAMPHRGALSREVALNGVQGRRKKLGLYGRENGLLDLLDGRLKIRVYDGPKMPKWAVDSLLNHTSSVLQVIFVF